jgi:hypothetical protein
MWNLCREWTALVVSDSNNQKSYRSSRELLANKPAVSISEAATFPDINSRLIKFSARVRAPSNKERTVDKRVSARGAPRPWRKVILVTTLLKPWRRAVKSFTRACAGANEPTIVVANRPPAIIDE